jgi:xanthine dehydrogenase iron-sulfur cluster and FAD-binding subunit A
VDRGFCTPGFVVAVTAFLRENPQPTDDEIREAISGNLCRCTGYQAIIAAVRAALDNTFTISVSVDAAWKVLLDIERIAPCVPGATITSHEGDDYRGTM